MWRQRVQCDAFECSGGGPSGRGGRRVAATPRRGGAGGGCIFPAPPRHEPRAFSARGTPAPSPLSREIARRSSQSGSAVAALRRLSRGTLARTSRELSNRTLAALARTEHAAKIVSSWPGTARGRCTPVTSGAMVPALLVLALAALAPAAARRHAPDLREDEPARRSTRPAGEC